MFGVVVGVVVVVVVVVCVCVCVCVCTDARVCTFVHASVCWGGGGEGEVKESCSTVGVISLTFPV